MLVVSPSIRVAAALPVRSFASGKARLAPALPLAARQALIVDLLAHVVAVLQQSAVIDVLAVVSDEVAVQDWARARQLEGVPSEGPGLRMATGAACRWAQARQAQALLVVLPDLPLLTIEDVRSLVGLRQNGGIVLAPDRHGSGTNAILLQPPDLMPTAFGPRSLAQHLALADERDVAVRIVERRGWGFDLDTPEDWEGLSASGWSVVETHRRG